MKRQDEDIESGAAFERSFIRLLGEDVIAARSQVEGHDCGTARRTVVRTTFAAIEGLMWILRNHVLDNASAIGTIKPLEEMAMRETTYFVSGNGVVIEQMRSVALQTAMKLIVNQALLIEPDLRVRFDHSGWAALHTAARIRNRITHPRSAEDLVVTDVDLSAVNAGMTWLMATAEYIMASTSLVVRESLANQRVILAALKAGDPEMLRAYEAAVARISDPGSE